MPPPGVGGQRPQAAQEEYTNEAENDSFHEGHLFTFLAWGEERALLYERENLANEERGRGNG
jgi:hypothetical protein